MNNCKRPASHPPVDVKLLFLGVWRLVPPATLFCNSQDHDAGFQLLGLLAYRATGNQSRMMVKALGRGGPACSVDFSPGSLAPALGFFLKVGCLVCAQAAEGQNPRFIHFTSEVEMQNGHSAY